ncbi:hypothetical protein CYMTET_12357 [Cymbomonas tetramitiformis]|uniref:Uncharacterized protein n=1 Tax=Cymbomonas tetramitiformis TaxID=36881 RepID=A0AAE0LBX4_9CHLO|nr:hypothetical protein CYMTET_12357 [Cymbomonas tetramitiformis]
MTPCWCTSTKNRVSFCGCPSHSIGVLKFVIPLLSVHVQHIEAAARAHQYEIPETAHVPTSQSSGVPNAIRRYHTESHTAAGDGDDVDDALRPNPSPVGVYPHLLTARYRQGSSGAADYQDTITTDYYYDVDRREPFGFNITKTYDSNIAYDSNTDDDRFGYAGPVEHTDGGDNPSDDLGGAHPQEMQESQDLADAAHKPVNATEHARSARRNAGVQDSYDGDPSHQGQLQIGKQYSTNAALEPYTISDIDAAGTTIASSDPALLMPERVYAATSKDLDTALVPIGRQASPSATSSLDLYAAEITTALAVPIRLDNSRTRDGARSYFAPGAVHSAQTDADEADHQEYSRGAPETNIVLPNDYISYTDELGTTIDVADSAGRLHFLSDPSSEDLSMVDNTDTKKRSHGWHRGAGSLAHKHVELQDTLEDVEDSAATDLENDDALFRQHPSEGVLRSSLESVVAVHRRSYISERTRQMDTAVNVHSNGKLPNDGNIVAHQVLENGLDLIVSDQNDEKFDSATAAERSMVNVVATSASVSNLQGSNFILSTDRSPSPLTSIPRALPPAILPRNSAAATKSAHIPPTGVSEYIPYYRTPTIVPLSLISAITAVLTVLSTADVIEPTDNGNIVSHKQLEGMVEIVNDLTASSPNAASIATPHQEAALSAKLDHQRQTR